MSTQKPQYHHYVPRFILRNFAVSPLPPPALKGNSNTTSQRSHKAPSNPQKSRINIYRLKEMKLEMAASLPMSSDKSISENYGVLDLYADANNPDRYHIEKKLSVLESRAAEVIRSLVDAAQSAAPPPVSIKRKDLNTLRKFLFLMSYRNSHHAEQFLTNRFDPQTGADLKKHIGENMESPQATNRDVWLQNIRAILDAKVWDIPENKRIFIHDRRFYTQEMRSYRLVLWQAPPGEEFVVCEGFGFYDGSYLNCTKDLRDQLRNNSYNAPHRGQSKIDEPLHPALDPDLVVGNPLHMWLRITPVSPRLVLVLSSKTLDADNAEILEIYLRMGPHSRFHSFPFPKPVTEYRDLTVAGREALARGDMHAFTGGSENTARMVQAMLDGHPAPYGLIDGTISESRENDIFKFPVAELNSEQVNLVNGLVLENAQKQLTFCSPQNMSRYITAYQEEQVWNKCPDYGHLKKALERVLGLHAAGAQTEREDHSFKATSSRTQPSPRTTNPYDCEEVATARDCRNNPDRHPRIPDFVLEHFEVTQDLAKIPSTAPARKSNGQEPPSVSTANRSEQVLNVYQFSHSALVLGMVRKSGEHRAHSCGRGSCPIDLEESHPTRLGEKLEKLERQAAEILTPIIETAKKKKAGSVVLVRRDLNVLSKFLFLWGYRNNTLGGNGRIYWVNLFDPSTRCKVYAKIKDKFTGAKVLEERGLDKWIASFNAFLSAKVWDIPFNVRLFDEDKVEFMRDIRRRRPVFWRSAEDDEFVISDNRFGFTDGIGYPTNYAMATWLDMPFFVPWLPPVDYRGVINGCVHVSFRIFPVSSNLAIVLADRILVDKEHGRMRAVITGKYPGSRLLSFPFPSPVVDYMCLSEEGRERMEQNVKTPADERYAMEAERLRTVGGLAGTPLIDGKIAESRESDRFHFPIVQLSKKQTEVINGLAIRNAEDCLVFRSPERLLRYVQEYEKEPIPSDFGDYGSLKRVLGECLKPQEPVQAMSSRAQERLRNKNSAKAWLEGL